MRLPPQLAVMVAAMLLAGCETMQQAGLGTEDPDPAQGEQAPADQETADATPADEGTAGTNPESAAPDQPAGENTAAANAAPVPHIYMALQPGGGGQPVSVIFAIDNARDNTPSDDPAVRLTPDGGDCNPQNMRTYDFPDPYAKPVVSEAEQARGLTAQQLPSYLAVTVSERMVENGLATELEETRPQNICTRKLWEQLVVANSPGAAPAGQ